MGGIARWISDAPRDWTKQALNHATRGIIDCIACSLAGSRDPVPKRVLHAISTLEGQGRGSVVLGTTCRLPAPWAALVNGTSAHALDYDDNLDPAVAHVSAVLVPALLSLSETLDVSGERFLDAYIVGVELISRLGEAMNMRHYQTGWHSTATLGTLGAAAACTRLLGLPQEKVSAAVGISTSMAAGSRAQFGTMMKPLHAGLSAKNGVLAAILAQTGITATTEAIAGKWGFHALFRGNARENLAEVFERLGNPPAIEEFGIWLKVYPCCTSAHQAIDGLLALRDEHRLTPENVTAVIVRLPQIFDRNLAYKRPENEMQARFSLEYCLASALCDGAVTLASFQPSAMARKQVREVMTRVSRNAVRAESGTHLHNRAWSVTVTAYLTNGPAVEKTLAVPRGHPSAPLNDADLDRKFSQCAEGVMGTAQVSGVLTLLRDIGSLRQIRTLAEQLHGSKETSP
jgi:2-methylcitrate dehydratase PrpD